MARSLQTEVRKQSLGEAVGNAMGRSCFGRRLGGRLLRSPLAEAPGFCDLKLETTLSPVPPPPVRKVSSGKESEMQRDVAKPSASGQGPKT